MRPNGALLAAALTVSAPALASGFQLFELSSRSIASAGVGQAVPGREVTAALLNPASTVGLARSAQISAHVIDLSARFKPSLAPQGFGGSAGGNAGSTTPVAALAAVTPVGDRAALSLAISSPFGLGVRYDGGWAGRYFVIRNRLRTFNTAVSAALQISPAIAIAGGVDLQRGDVAFDAAVNNVLDRLPDGALALRLDDWAIAAHAGAEFALAPATTVGATFRTAVDYRLSGRARFAGVGPTLRALGLVDGIAVLKQKLPATAALGMTQRIGATDVTAELGWTGWKVFRSSDVRFASGAVDQSPRRFKDAWRAGLAVERPIGADWSARAGVSLDGSPVRDRDRLPDIAVDRQWRIGAGAFLAVGDSGRVSAAMEYVDLGPNQLDIAKSPLTGRLTGRYRQRAVALSLSAGWTW